MILTIEQSPRLPRNLPVVAAWMAGALISFVVAAMSIRTLSPYLNVFEINIFRTGGGLLVMSVLLLASAGMRSHISMQDAPKHLLRNLIHASGGFFWTMAISMLPLATVFSLEFTAPAWAALLSYPILGERTSAKSYVGLAASLAGTLIVLRPTAASFSVEALLPLLAAACLGMSALLTRRLTRSQTTASILFWMMSIQFAVNVGGEWTTGSQMLVSDVPSLVLAAGLTLAVAGLASQLCLSQALRLGEASLVMPLDFLRVPLIAWIGFAFYGEALDVWVYVGATLIALGVVFGSSLPRLARR